MGTEQVVRCPHGYTWPYCPWGCTIGRPEDTDLLGIHMWPPTKIPDLDSAVEERDLVVKLRQARQQLWALVAAWEVRPELREAAKQLTAVLESYDE